MQKLPTPDSTRYEFTYYATLSMKNAMAVEAINNHLCTITERVNELIDRDSNVDLEAFKVSFLSELEAILTKDESMPETNDLDLQDRFNLLELQFEALTQRISKIEFALGHGIAES